MMRCAYDYTRWLMRRVCSGRSSPTAINVPRTQILDAAKRGSTYWMQVDDLMPTSDVRSMVVWYIGVMMTAADELASAVEVASPGFPDRNVRAYGWAVEGGIVLVTTDPRLDDPSLPAAFREEEDQLLVRVSPSGEVTPGTYLVFMEDIKRGQVVGDWPSD